MNRGRLCNTVFHPEIAEPHLLTQNHNSVLRSSLIERQLHYLGRNISISNLDLEHGPSFRDIWRNIAHAYAYSESWRERPTRNLSDTLIFENDFLTLARNSLACNPEADSDPSGSLLLLLLNRSSSDKITLLVQSNSEIESRFDRRCLLVNIVSVQAHPCLQSQDVSGSETCGFQ